MTGTDRNEPDWKNCDDADAHRIYRLYDALPLCSCGNTLPILAAVRDVLRACPLYEAGRWQQFYDRYGEMGGELLLHVVDHAGLTEHGTSVGGSWITEDGAFFLSVLEGLDFDNENIDPIEALDRGGFYCSDCPPIAASSGGAP